jgi:hypothetical protein
VTNWQFTYTDTRTAGHEQVQVVDQADPVRAAFEAGARAALIWRGDGPLPVHLVKADQDPAEHGGPAYDPARDD